MSGDDDVTVERAKRGDREAFAALVRKHQRRVYSTGFHITGNHGDADDVAQDAFLRAFKALPGFDGRSQFFTWLYRIAYTTFLNHIRRPRRVTSFDDGTSPEVADASPAVDQLISEREEGARLRAAVMTLPEDLRFTVAAHFWGGLPVKEIARIENITGVAVRKRLHKAFAILELSLDEEKR